MLDVLVVGAGAAGISAARTLSEAGRSVEILEARSRVGGRAHTIQLAGQSVDVGAHWMHMAERNPLVRLARDHGFRTRRAPGDRPLYDHGRLMLGDRRRMMGQAWPRLDRALARALRQGVDRPLADCLPSVGEWTDTFAFDMGLYSGAAAEEVSALDFHRTEDGANRFPASGYGALIAHLASSLQVRFDCAVSTIRDDGGHVVVESFGGAIMARAAIVTVPMALLQAGGLRFDPDLPQEIASAIGAFTPAAYEHAIISWPDSPLHRNGADQLTLFKSDRVEGATMLACINGGDLHYVELGGPHRALWRDGDGDWKRQYVGRFLASHFGAESARAKILHLTDWWNDPWSRSSWSVAPPGHSVARNILRRFGDGGRIRFASEATSSTQWGTVGGAWREGARAARQIIAGVSDRARDK